MKSRVALGRLGQVCLLALAIFVMTLPSVASPKSFGQADAAWHKGELEKAKDLYEAALAKGGLEPAEVVIAYSRVGTVKAALRDKQGALSAFRVAAAIDPEFELPADSGPVARKLYAKARNESAQQGGEKLSITLAAPDNVPARQPFTVSASIPEGFAVLVAEVVVTVTDPITGKKWEQRQPAGPSVTVQFESETAITGAKLKVKASAVDGQNNAWAMSQANLKVDGVRQVSSMDDSEISPFDEGEGGKKDDDGTSLFDGPLPWIVGGAVILVGGIVLVAATRQPDTVNVGAPSWQ